MMAEQQPHAAHETRVLVIGGGAAGLMAAHTAALYGASVTLFDKNERLGRKLLITGKWSLQHHQQLRCQHLHCQCDNQQPVSL